MLGITVAHGSEYPSKVYSSTTAREHEVVVEFIGLGCGSVERGALDREHDGGVAGIHKNVAAEAIYRVLPSYWERLRTEV